MVLVLDVPVALGAGPVTGASNPTLVPIVSSDFSFSGCVIISCIYVIIVLISLSSVGGLEPGLVVSSLGSVFLFCGTSSRAQDVFTRIDTGSRPSVWPCWRRQGSHIFWNVTRASSICEQWGWLRSPVFWKRRSDSRPHGLCGIRTKQCAMRTYFVDRQFRRVRALCVVHPRTTTRLHLILPLVRSIRAARVCAPVDRSMTHCELR